MRALSWNCQGLSNHRTIQFLCRLVKEKLTDFIFIMETKLRSEKVEVVQKKLGFKDCMVVESRRLCGGLVMMWKDVEGVELWNYSQWHISLWVKNKGESSKWLMTGFYGHREVAKRKGY
ncbi:hypothetical protein I3843_07G102500 [Carya illinoinensis]|nr:hypothetical protein I3843_07G102500 [Carya illinoinensis]